MKSKGVGENLIQFLNEQFKIYLRKRHFDGVKATYIVKTILLSKKMKGKGDSQLIEALNYCIYDAQRTLDRLQTNTTEVEIKLEKAKQLYSYIEIYKELKETFTQVNNH